MSTPRHSHNTSQGNKGEMPALALLTQLPWMLCGTSSDPEPSSPCVPWLGQCPAGGCQPAARGSASCHGLGCNYLPTIDGGGTGSSRAACFLRGLLQILELSVVASFNCKFVYRMLGSLQNSQTNPKPSTELLMQWVPGRPKGPWEQRIPQSSMHLKTARAA